MIRPSTRLLFLGLLAAPAAAQVVPNYDLLLGDDAQTQDQILVARDLDSDGYYASANELDSIYANLGNWVTTVEFRVESGVNVAYWYDQKVVSAAPANGLGAIWRGADANFDGKVNGGEVTLYYDFGTLEGKMGGDGLALTDDGAVWWSGGTVANITETDKGLFRCKDLNNDGDAMDAGETVQLIQGMSGSFTVETDAGSQVMNASNLRRLAEDGNAVIAYEDGLDEAAFRFEDKNGDGDLLDAGEARLFLNATGKNALLPKNPDWTNGLLRDLLVSSTNNTYGRLSHVATRLEGGVRNYYLACDSSNTSQFAKNHLLEGINGLVFRGVDFNLDGDINDAGEVSLYYDGSTTSYAAFEIGKVVGLDGCADGIFIADFNGANRVHYFHDVNADSDANDLGEQVMAVLDTVTYQGAPPITAPPFVTDVAVAPAGSYPYGWVVTGTPCSYYGPLPQIRSSGSPKLGTSNFSVRVENALPFMPGILYIGTSSTTWASVPLPLDLTLFGLSGCNLYQDLAFSLKGFTNSFGVLSKTLTIPNDSTLTNVQIPFQWVMIDAATSTLGFSALGQATLQQ